MKRYLFLFVLLFNSTKMLISHTVVNKSNKPIIFLNIINQLPGFGINEIIFGNSNINMSGVDKPIPITIRIVHLSVFIGDLNLFHFFLT